MNRRSNDPPAIRTQYQKVGVTPFYAQHGADYRNPHEAAIGALLRAMVAEHRLALSCALALACGSGEATLVLRELGAARVDGVDPYTGAAYRARTGSDAAALSFADVVAGALDGRAYSLVVCSFALHLLAPSLLPALLFRLQAIAPTLLVLTPHKRPHIQPAWGWRLTDERAAQRVRARLYRAQWPDGSSSPEPGR